MSVDTNGAAPGAGRPGPLRRLVGLGGLFAGLAAFLIGEATYQLIPPKLVSVPNPGTVIMAPTAVTQGVADVRNAAIAFAALGGCLGGFLGLAGGLSRRSTAAAVTAGLLGLLLGAAVPAVVSFAAIPMFQDAQLNHPDYDIFLSMGLHGLIWGLCGAVAGLALAVGMGPADRRLLWIAPAAGLLGAVVGSIVFDMVGAALFPFADIGEPISTTWLSRLMARVLVALGAAFALILRLPARRPAPPSATIPEPAPPE